MSNIKNCKHRESSKQQSVPVHLLSSYMRQNLAATKATSHTSRFLPNLAKSAHSLHLQDTYNDVTEESNTESNSAGIIVTCLCHQLCLYSPYATGLVPSLLHTTSLHNSSPFRTLFLHLHLPPLVPPHQSHHPYWTYSPQI